jgi:hypothetical protein
MARASIFPGGRASRFRLIAFTLVGGGVLGAVAACSSSGDTGTPLVDGSMLDGPADSQVSEGSADGSLDSTMNLDAPKASDATDASMETSSSDAGDATTGDGAGGDASSSDAGDGGSIDAAGDAKSDADAGPSCDLDAGLVGYWPFDEGTGTTTADRSGKGSPGTLMNSPVWSTSVPPTPYPNARSLSFDGVQSFVTMGNPMVLRFSGPLSITAWFKTSATLGNYATLVSKWWSGGTEAAYTILWTNGGGPLFEIGNAALAGIGAGAATPYTDGNWHFVAGTWGGATITLYIDGKAVNSTTTDASFDPLDDITDPFDVATDNRYAPNGGGNRFFPGFVDDVRAYSRALSAEEVGQLFNGTCGAL